MNFSAQKYSRSIQFRKCRSEVEGHFSDYNLISLCATTSHTMYSKYVINVWSSFFWTKLFSRLSIRYILGLRVNFNICKWFWKRFHLKVNIYMCRFSTIPINLGLSLSLVTQTHAFLSLLVLFELSNIYNIIGNSLWETYIHAYICKISISLFDGNFFLFL